MKKLLPLLFIAFFACLASACKKTGSDNQGGKLEGTWIKTEYLVSPGNMGTWQPYTGGVFVMIFNEDGRLEVTKPFMAKSYDHYSVIDKKKLKLYNSSNSDSTQLNYEIKGGKLTLWLECIEPCGIRLERPAK